MLAASLIGAFAGGLLALLAPCSALLLPAFFAYTGAIFSHLATGYDLAELGLLAVLVTLTVLSWALRPPSRRMWRRASDVPPPAAG